MKSEHDGDGEPDDPRQRGRQELVTARRDESGPEHEPGEGTPDRDDDAHREVPAEAEHRAHENGHDSEDDVVHSHTVAGLSGRSS